MPLPQTTPPLELITGDAQALKVLLGVLQDAFLERHLGCRIDREGQREVLLQTADAFDHRILLAGLLLAGLGFR